MSREKYGIPIEGDPFGISSSVADDEFANGVLGNLTCTQAGLTVNRESLRAPFLEALGARCEDDYQIDDSAVHLDEEEQSALQARRALKKVRQMIAKRQPGSVYFPELTPYHAVTGERFRRGISDLIEHTPGTKEVRHYPPEIVDEINPRVAEWATDGFVVRSHIQVTPDHTVIGSYYEVHPRPQF